MKKRQALILGVGNVLWADEGFGVRAVEALHAGWVFGDDVTLMDGGTQGLSLYPYIMNHSHVLVFDAIAFHEPPATLRVLRDDEIPKYCTTKVSPHQITLNEVLAHAQLLGSLPDHMTVVGVQPEKLDDYGGSLRPAIRARLPEAVAMGVAEMQKWGFSVRQRTPDEACVPLNAEALALSRYENERPSAEDACRIGDPRFFPEK